MITPTAVTRALSSEQREEIVHRFTTANPEWRGASSADVLDVLFQTDANLDTLEPFFNVHPQWERLIGSSFLALAIVWSGQELTDPAMQELLNKIESGGNV
jgi:hypothetical protein